ncbi:phosphomannomutase CpsG [Colwelliaceae bacterium BS250]
MKSLSCFKAYDIRGKLGDELNEDIVYVIARAFAQILTPKDIVIGGDCRLTSIALKHAFIKGLIDEAVNVIDLGLTGTEEIYFATSYLSIDGGVEVTASHNPLNFNGLKFVKKGSEPLSVKTGELNQIKLLSEQLLNDPAVQYINTAIDPSLGRYKTLDLKQQYATKMLTFIDAQKLNRFKIVVNAGNGVAGPAFDAIEQALIKQDVHLQVIKLNHQPDGNFPNGIPNPLLTECRHETQQAVIDNDADIGIAWDGDFDRCFLFDENGRFIEGYYIVGLLAQAFLQQTRSDNSELKPKPNSEAELDSKHNRHPELVSKSGRHPELVSNTSRHPELVSGSYALKEKIIHDPRLIWNTQDIVQQEQGTAVMSQAGHVYIKELMRSENAIYGGEMSAHHYFRDFSYCDSGMIPWLLVVQLLSNTGKPLSTLVDDMINNYPSSGEINLVIDQPISAIANIKAHYLSTTLIVDETDGISMEFNNDEGQWRFNLRSSNTEPLVRLNVESKADIRLMESKTQEILELLKA